jgi:hypothetical protein
MFKAQDDNYILQVTILQIMIIKTKLIVKKMTDVELKYAYYTNNTNK